MNKKQSLDSDLNRYSHMAHTVLDHKAPTRKHLSEWALYTAAVSSALALAPVAEASIIYSGVQNISLHPSPPDKLQTTQPPLAWSDSTSVDLDGDGQKDIKFRAFAGLNCYGSHRDNGSFCTGGGMASVLGAREEVSLLNRRADVPYLAFVRGMTIDDTIPTYHFPATGPQWMGGSPDGFSNGVARRHLIIQDRDANGEIIFSSNYDEAGVNFTGLAHGLPLNQPAISGYSWGFFAGVRLMPPGGGDPNFGWLHLELDANNPLLLTQDLTLVDWAYQSVPGKSIRVGDKGSSATPVPEPSTLALMALGAVGMGTLRRRRNREHNKQAQ